MSAEEALERMIDLNWSANWSELPPEAEQEVEKAYGHLAKARDMIESIEE